MNTRQPNIPWRASALLALAMLCACSPRYNWRESGDGAHFAVLLPAKPANATRTVDLDGPRVEMSMTAAEAGGATFAVGTAELADAAAAGRALDAMAAALLNNIGARTQPSARLPGNTEGFARVLELQAQGAAGGRTLRLAARLLARDRRVYQLLVVGDEQAFTDENLETFFGSFKPR